MNRARGVVFVDMSLPEQLFRPALRPLASNPAIAVACIFALHAAIRFGGLASAHLIPLSMVIIWPLPWLLASRQGRRRMGFGAPQSSAWFALGPVVAVGLLVACAALAFGLYGDASANWLTQHALVLRQALEPVPGAASTLARFWIVTAPAMIFSPLAEEFLYRGFIQSSVSQRWGRRAGSGVQAAAFAVVHLAHYGLVPFEPALIAVWVPSMFAVALVFGWMVEKSGSVWVAVVAHAVFNLALNGAVFLLLPDLVGG